MKNFIRLATSVVVVLTLLLCSAAFSQEADVELPDEPFAAEGDELEALEGADMVIGLEPVMEEAAPAVEVPLPTHVTVSDLPNDDGTGLVVEFEKAPGETEALTYTVSVGAGPDGPWQEIGGFPATKKWKEEARHYYPAFFLFQKGRAGMSKNFHMFVIQELGDNVPLETGVEYFVRLTASVGDVSRNYAEILSATPEEQWFDTGRTNVLIFAVLFGATILYFIARARRDPNLFIRKISGLDAVDEAIGRATEMGRPILYLNGIDTLAALPTLAALNILGRVARRVANYESSLIVPCKDPIVLTVAQEIVKAGYTDAGRPDAYNPDSIFFLTEDQFSYAAGVCGIMMRDKPAANFLMGYYAAESLILAETGADTGAIQIAGTDAVHQLPFFVTTCDYTLIGEELYAASAYLSREPLILGSLKGQDMAKVFMMVMIIVGTLLVTFGIAFIKDFFLALG